MSRTTRTTPRWILSQMKEENQYRNHYRGVRYYADGSHDMETFTSRRSQVKESQMARTERLTLYFSKDGAETSLYHTCRKSVCVGHKVKMEGWAFDVGKNGFRKYVKKHWSKLNRIHSKWVAWNEYVDDYYGDDEDWYNRRMQQEACEEFYDMIRACYEDEFLEDRAANNTYAHGYSDGYNAALRDMANASIKRTA